MSRSEQIHSIAEAARLCGVTEKQIRHWEFKEHIPKPDWVICGKRNYCQFSDLDSKRSTRGR